MGLVHIELFATLDLVGQAPGGPEEDPEGGFPSRRLWQAPLAGNEVAGAKILAAYEDTDASAAGPADTYDIFAAYGPLGPRTARTTRSPGSSTAFRSTWRREARLISRGPGPRSSAPTCQPRCGRSGSGTGTSRWSAA